MKITFILGGARSGKSAFALNEASKTEGRKAFIATAQAFDEEMKERISKHRKERGPEWDTYEEPVNIVHALSDLKGKYNAIVLDCLTLWLSNLLIRAQSTDHRTQTEDKCIGELIETLHKSKHSSLVTRHSSLFIVSNEVGMGIVPENELARRFRDLAGSLNRRLAEISDEVYLVTAGIPMKIKNSR
ncbi:MAG: bifunctional adenosylcobinamide kinase/adenosylcobinamide-phosphate guanylyltransferase [Nitrospirae bacterium]|nr:bifunctional adenosylcobinamide kinase/adenosylcobinamide-phosphate guanylyltransferase [Nitrospirota bacterium]